MNIINKIIEAIKYPFGSGKPVVKTTIKRGRKIRKNRKTKKANKR
jgi:hypothetical protein